MDVSFYADMVRHAAVAAGASVADVANEMQRPSVLFRPTLSADGTMWCALLGENLQEGVAGFGETPDAAMRAFDAAFLNERTPASRRAALGNGGDGKGT